MKYVISATAILLANVGVFALPQGGRVESGTGNLDNPAHIIQESQHLQTRWDSFDIAAKEQVRIEQPNAQASINIKVSNNGGATTINGTLTANGRVSLENPAGIQFGENSVVNVGGLLASSANGSVTSLGQVSATEAIRFQSLSGESVVNVGGNVSAQEIIVEGNGDIIIGNSATFTANKQVLIGGGYQGKDSHVLNSQKTDVKAAAQINAPYVIVWSDKETSFLGRIDAGRGFVEVSGKQHLIFPDINRAKAGTLLLDPLSVFIDGRRGGFAGDEHIKDDGTVNVDEFSGQNFGLGVDAINNYNGNVVLTALGSITVRADANINKSNGSLTLSANNIVINAAITISGAGHYLSFELTGAVNATPFTFGTAADSVGSIVTDDLRIANNYTGSRRSRHRQVEISSRFAAAGRSVMMTAPAHGSFFLNSGFNLCSSEGTGCGNLTIDAGVVSLGGTFAAGNINLTATTRDIFFYRNPTLTAATITLTQNAAFDRASPAKFSVVPVARRVDLPAGTAYAHPDWATCPSGDTNCGTPQDIVLVDQTTDIVLTDVIDGKFSLTDGDTTLDLQGSDLDLRTTANILLPAGLTSITTTGDITLVAGSILTLGGTAIGNNLNVNANVLTLGGAINAGTNSLTLETSGGALLFATDTTINGGDITLVGRHLYSSSANVALVIDSSSTLTITGSINVGTGSIALTAGSGAIVFTPAVLTDTFSISDRARLTAGAITLTQSAAYPNARPAGFSVSPALNRTGSDNFNAPGWGECGTDAQCFSSGSIYFSGIDATLTDLIVGKFFITDAGVLDLGTSLLSIYISGVLTLPAGLTQIVTDSNDIRLKAGTFSSTTDLTIQTTTRGDITLQGSYVSANSLTLTSAGALDFGRGGAETSITASAITLTTVAVVARFVDIELRPRPVFVFVSSRPKLSLSASTIVLNTNISVRELVLSTGSIDGSASTIFTPALTLDYTGTTAVTFAGSHWVFAKGRDVTLRTTDSGATINLFAADSDDDTINLCTARGNCGNLTIDAAGGIGLVASTETTVGLGTISANNITLNATSIGSSTETNRNLILKAAGNLTIDTPTLALINTQGAAAALTFDVAGSTTFTQDITIDSETISGLGGDITAEALTLSSGGAATGSIAFSTARETSITTTGDLTLEFERAGTASGQNLTLTASGGDITLGSLNIGSGS